MKARRPFVGRTILLLGLLAVGLVAGGLQPPEAWAQASQASSTLQAFNRAALQGDLKAVEGLLSKRFLASTAFATRKLSSPGRLREEVRLMSFYQIVREEPLDGSQVRVQVVQRRLVGGQGFVTRWYYMVRDGARWKLDRIGAEQPYR